MFLSRHRLRLRSLGMGLGGIVMAIVVLIDGLEMVIRRSNMPCSGQVMVFACRVDDGGSGGGGFGGGGGGSHDVLLGGV